MHAQPVVVIFSAKGAVIITADNGGNVGPIEEAGTQKIVSRFVEVGQRSFAWKSDRGGTVWTVLRSERRIGKRLAPVVDGFVVRVGQAGGRIALERLDEARELPWQHDVVGGSPGEVLSPRVLEAVVEGGRQLLVRLTEHANP